MSKTPTYRIILAKVAGKWTYEIRRGRVSVAIGTGKATLEAALEAGTASMLRYDAAPREMLRRRK